MDNKPRFVVESHDFDGKKISMILDNQHQKFGCPQWAVEIAFHSRWRADSICEQLNAEYDGSLRAIRLEQEERTKQRKLNLV